MKKSSHRYVIHWADYTNSKWQFFIQFHFFLTPKNMLFSFTKLLVSFLIEIASPYHVNKWNRWRINVFMWLLLYSFWASHCLSSQLFKNFWVGVTLYYNLMWQLKTKSHVREFPGCLVVRASCFHCTRQGS